MATNQYINKSDVLFIKANIESSKIRNKIKCKDMIDIPYRPTIEKGKLNNCV